MSAERIMVRPGEGRRVRMPGGRVLTTDKTPAKGVPVDRSIYVERRLACGDLVIVDDKAPAAAAAAPAKSAPAAVAPAADVKGA